jgi:DNA-binding transcriptional ArsR family regulator
MAPADFLRVAVTVDYTAPETPLAAADLLALSGNRARTRLFVERYLRLSPRHRSNVFHILDDPLRAQRELSETLEWYAEGPFAALEPHLRNERERAGERLREIVAAHAGEWPRWLAQRELLPLHVRLTGFSPVVLAPVAFLRHGRGTYYHEIQHPLFDNTEYEPLILSLASDAVLAPDPLRRRGRGARGRDTGEDVLAMLPSEQRVAAIFAALADPSRLRLVRLLAERPHYGQELATALGMSAATVSHHTSVLMKANLVTIERQAHRTYYVLGREQLMVQLHEGERFALGDGSDAPAAELPPRVEQS